MTNTDGLTANFIVITNKYGGPLLALLIALVLVPATVSDLLGMNLLDTPWSATLAQVSIGIAAGMASASMSLLLRLG